MTTKGLHPSAAEIVRALAAIDDPTVADRDYSPAGECGLCDAADEGPDYYAHNLDDPKKHKKDCPWRLANEWMAGDPTDGKNLER